MPIWIIFAYYYYFVVIEFVTIDLYYFFFDRSFFEIIQNAKFDLFGAYFLFLISVFVVLAIPLFICGILLIMLFGIIHTFRKINQPSIKDKDEDLGNSKSASSLVRFFYLGFMYILRIIATLIRKKNET